MTCIRVQISKAQKKNNNAKNTKPAPNITRFDLSSYLRPIKNPITRNALIVAMIKATGAAKTPKCILAEKTVRAVRASKAKNTFKSVLAEIT